MSLKKWFERYTRRPLTISVFLVVLVLTVFSVQQFRTESRERDKIGKQLSGLLSLAASQKNRVLAESLLDISKTQIGAASAAICEGADLIISVSTASCAQTHSLFEYSTVHEIPGFATQTLVLKMNRFERFSELGILLLIGVTLIGTVIITLSRVNLSIRQDLIEPLLSGFLENKILPIYELEALRKNVQGFHENEIALARANAVVDLATKVAHDIRSPLSALFMLSRLPGQLNEERRSLFQKAVTRIDRIAADLLKNRKNFGAEMSEETVDLNELITDVIKERCVIDSDVSVSTVLSAEPVFANVSRSMFERAFSNILNNAIEASTDGSAVLVRCEKSEGSVSVEVLDRGCGLTAKAKQAIHSGVEYSSKLNGNGIGLRQVREFTSRYQSDFALTANGSRGTRATMTIPIKNGARRGHVSI